MNAMSRAPERNPAIGLLLPYQFASLGIAANDPAVRAEVEKLNRAWELLDLLQRRAPRHALRALVGKLR